MEFISGVREKETVCIQRILEGDLVGESVKMNGAVHTIRDMGEVAFVILRKADGLVQCVYEAGVTKFDLKNLKEESAVEITGTVAPEERAPHGFEIRLKDIRVLSEPAEVMPIAISKYKMNTSSASFVPGDEAGAAAHLPSECEGAGQVQTSGRHRERISGLLTRKGIYGNPHAEDCGPRRRGRLQCI